MTQEIKGQIVGYIRVSTLLQNTARQEMQLSGYKIDELFTDYCSGKDSNRPQLQAALKHLRKNDLLIVQSMDRLARNLDDLRKIVNDLTKRGIKVQFIKESLTFTGNDSSMSNLLLSVMGAFAEFERSLIRERQREGIEIAKSKGKYKGRKKALTENELITLRNKDKENSHKNRSTLAKEFNISRQSLYNYIG
jgi:DNA invertase Pin-like site-specific DNA recombinase